MKPLPATALVLMLLTLSLSAAPEDIGTVKLRDGRVLEEVRVVKKEPDGLRIQHKSGVGKIRMEDLPLAVSQRFQLDETSATAWRMEEKKRQDEADSLRRRGQVKTLLETTQTGQNEQARMQRITIFEQARNGANYAALDEQLRSLIQLWREAGREDLAARFEEDQALLRQQEISRPGAEIENDRQTLIRRVENLRRETDELRQQPPASTSTTVVVQDPYYIRSRPYYYYPTRSYYYNNVHYHPTVRRPYCPPVVVRPPAVSPYCPPSVPSRVSPVYRPTPPSPLSRPVVPMKYPVSPSVPRTQWQKR